MENENPTEIEGFPQNDPACVLLSVYEGDNPIAEAVSFRDGKTFVRDMGENLDSPVTIYSSLPDAINSFSPENHEFYTVPVNFGKDNA